MKSLNRWLVYDVMFVTMPNRLRENIWLKMMPILRTIFAPGRGQQLDMFLESLPKDSF